MAKEPGAPSQLVLGGMPHPSRPNVSVLVFGDWAAAVQHIQAHLLIEPELSAWLLVIPELREFVELSDELARTAYHERAERSRGATAQDLYDLFCRSVRQASRDAFRLKWFAETIGTRGQAVTLAIGTAGVLLVVENWLKTAFLPGQGDPQAVLDQRESRGPREESPRAGRRGMRPDVPGDSQGKDREDREQRRREEGWNDGQKLYYKVFRPAIQFVRSHYEIEFDARGERKRGEYGLLKSVLPPMSQLKYDNWLALREQAVNG